jgi:hypothetical protein
MSTRSVEVAHQGVSPSEKKEKKGHLELFTLTHFASSSSS